ncbi:hypothetical protein ACSVBT_06985 [Afipia sp. TerB]
MTLLAVLLWSLFGRKEFPWWIWACVAVDTLVNLSTLLADAHAIRLAFQ